MTRGTTCGQNISKGLQPLSCHRGQNFVLQAGPSPWKVENCVNFLFVLSPELLCYCRNFTAVVLVLEVSSIFGIQGLLEGPSAHL